MLWHFHFWAHAFSPNVHVRMLTVVSSQLLNLRSHIPRFRHGPDDPVFSTALSFAPLLHDLPDVYFQRLSDELCMVQLHGVAYLCFPSDIFHPEYQESHAPLRIYSLRHEERRSPF